MRAQFNIKKIQVAAILLLLSGCGKSPSSSVSPVPSASDKAASAVEASASPSATATQTGDNIAPQFQDADADAAPIYSFSRAEARYWLQSEAKRTPVDADFDTTWYGFESDAYLGFFQRACQELHGPALKPKDEFDTSRSRAAIRNAREACMKRLSDDVGAPPTLERVALPVIKQKDIAWDPDNGTFDLFVRADEAIFRQRELSERQQFRVEDATIGYPRCGGPSVLAIALPTKGAFKIGRADAPIFSLLVQDPVRAKAAKSRLIAARTLRVELLVRDEGYGVTGSSCVNGASGTSVKSDEHGYQARLLAVRLTDGKEQLTNWTKADQAAAILAH
jgi:hypothetical protein